MSYGVEQYGLGSFGGSDFIVTNQIPTDQSTGIDRLPTISFILFSQSGNVTLSSINLTITTTALGTITLIQDGIFTVAATGTIDNTDPTAVHVVANILHAFSPLETVIVNVDAKNISNEFLGAGASWEFTVNSVITTFQTHITRSFDRVFRLD